MSKLRCRPPSVLGRIFLLQRQRIIHSVLVGFRVKAISLNGRPKGTFHKKIPPAGKLVYGCLIAEAVEHLLQPAAVEADHHLVTDGDDRNSAPFGNSHHLLECLRVLADVILSECDALLRKKLLRLMAIGSSGRGVNLYQ